MKSKEAFIIYCALTVVLWQLALTLGDIIIHNDLDFEPVFVISNTMNNGAAFGIFEHHPEFLGWLGVVALIIIVSYMFLKVSFKHKDIILISSVFSSGILGNTIQRFQEGYVHDFIKLSFIDFPIFNMFDILICSSVFMYILLFIREEMKS